MSKVKKQVGDERMKQEGLWGIEAENIKLRRKDRRLID